MKTRNLLAFAAALSFVAAAAVLGEEAEKAKAPKKGGGTAPVFMPAADLKWTDLDPTGAPGVKIADVWGNHATGGFGAFVKFPAGFMTPLHTHTNTLKIVVISGTFLQTPEGKAEVRLGPGSYELQPGGNYRHTTGCDKASECLFFTQGTGKFDLKPVDTSKAPANK
jgi:hypothetical protein